MQRLLLLCVCQPHCADMGKIENQPSPQKKPTALLLAAPYLTPSGDIRSYPSVHLKHQGAICIRRWLFLDRAKNPDSQAGGCLNVAVFQVWQSWVVDCCIVKLVAGHAYSIASASEYPSGECIPTNSQPASPTNVPSTLGQPTQIGIFWNEAYHYQSWRNMKET